MLEHFPQRSGATWSPSLPRVEHCGRYRTTLPWSRVRMEVLSGPLALLMTKMETQQVRSARRPLSHGLATTIKFGPVQQVAVHPMDVDGASFSAVAGGNPSQNGTASVLCPCLLQTTDSSGQLGPNTERGNDEKNQNNVNPQGQLPPPPPTYVLLAGDPGLNPPGCSQNGTCHNVGDAFNLASTTAYNSLSGQGNLALSWRVSTVQDFVNALTHSGNIQAA